MDVEQRIRERAYAIWQEEGCPEGCDYQHWVRAEKEIAGSSPEPVTTKSNGRTAAKKPAAGDAPAVAGRKPRARKATVTA
ncbi:MAG TPA: DUF2934 domain-containing protein [Azospirillum sp.]|nr:DUF2934 domain-containing protein [Azospirillum sp.]